MRDRREAQLLRIFLGEKDRRHSKPLYEAILLKARELGLKGATVLRGPIGFGRSSRLHESKFFRLSDDLPVIIEIVDSKERIDAFLPVVDAMMVSGLVTLERAEVLAYRAHYPNRCSGVRA